LIPFAAVSLAGAVLLLAWPVIHRLARGARWALPLVIAILAILLDVRGIASSGGLARYAGTAIVLVAVIAMRSGGARAGRALWFFSAVLCAYGLFGTVYGRFWFGTQDGAFPVVLPLLICLAGWARPVAIETDLRFALNTIAFLGSVFAFWCAAVRLGVLPGEPSVYGHEKAFIVVLAVASARAARSRWLTVLSLVAAIAAFATYPAATYIVAGFSALLTYVLVRWSPGRPIRTVLGVGGMAVVLWAVMHVDALVRFTSSYFALVEKTNNGATRETLYEIALRQLTVHPMFAHFFTGDLTVATTLAGRSGVILPIHNDYLGVALSGGIVAAALLLSIFMFANGCAIRAVKVYGISSTHRLAITALLASLNAAAVTAFANPVFMNPGTNTAVCSIIFALVSLCVEAEVKGKVPRATELMAVPYDGRSVRLAAPSNSSDVQHNRGWSANSTENGKSNATDILSGPRES
jgi:hypothetical protein